MFQPYIKQQDSIITLAYEKIAEARRQKRVLYCLEHCDCETDGLIEVDDLGSLMDWIKKLEIKKNYVFVPCEIEFVAVQDNTDFSDCGLDIPDIEYGWLGVNVRDILYDYYTMEDLFPRESCLYSYDNIKKKFYLVLDEEFINNQKAEQQRQKPCALTEDD